MSDLSHLLTPAQRAASQSNDSASFAEKNESYHKTTARNRRGNPVAMYMMAAYAYYMDDDPIMDDWSFDMLAKQILEDYETHSKHPHCPSEDDLKAGTYLGEYPNIVRGALDAYRRQIQGL